MHDRPILSREGRGYEVREFTLFLDPRLRGDERKQDQGATDDPTALH